MSKREIILLDGIKYMIDSLNNKSFIVGYDQDLLGEEIIINPDVKSTTVVGIKSRAFKGIRSINTIKILTEKLDIKDNAFEDASINKIIVNQINFQKFKELGLNPIEESFELLDSIINDISIKKLELKEIKEKYKLNTNELNQYLDELYINGLIVHNKSDYGIIKMNYSLKLIKDEYQIIRYLGKSKKIKIPTEIDGVKVTTINHHAFILTDNIEEIIIPKSVRTIHKHAFKKCESTSIYFENSDINLNYFTGINLNNVKLGLKETVYFENVEYKIFNDNTAVVSNYTNDELVTSVYIQEQIEGVRVTKIASYAFNNAPVIEVIIPKSIIEIRDYAFIEAFIENMKIPESVISLGIGVFYNCYNLRRIIYNNKIRQIPKHTHYDNKKLEKVILPDNIKIIRTKAFYNCSSLVFIDLPNLLKVIEEKSFMSCNYLTSIILPESLVMIGKDIFVRCYNLTNLIILSNNISLDKNIKNPNTLIYSKVKMSSENNTIDKELSIIKLNNVVYMVLYSHAVVLTYDNLLTSANLTIKENVNNKEVTEIASNAFSYRYDLEKIYMPTTVTKVGYNAFRRTGIKEIISIGDNTKLEKSIFENKFIIKKNKKKVDIHVN